MHEHTMVDLINQDSSVGEFLDPHTWIMASVRLPWDHNGSKKIRLARIDGEWLALQHLSIDDNFTGEEKDE